MPLGPADDSLCIVEIPFTFRPIETVIFLAVTTVNVTTVTVEDTPYPKPKSSYAIACPFPSVPRQRLTDISEGRRKRESCSLWRLTGVDKENVS